MQLTLIEKADLQEQIWTVTESQGEKMWFNPFGSPVTEQLGLLSPAGQRSALGGEDTHS